MMFFQHSKKQPGIVMLWAAPRCASTVFEKSFSQCPDTSTIHEPFLDVYYFSKWRRSNRFRDHEELQDYRRESVVAQINAQTAFLTFIKEMAYQALPYVDNAFFDSVLNTFIIRHPCAALASWYRLNEFPTEEEFGFTFMEKVWEIVTHELKHEPIVVEANRFRCQPEQVMKAYCQRIGVEFSLEMLNWKKDSLKQERKPHQLELHVRWHKTLDNSTGILPPTEETEVEIRPEEEKMLERALIFYEKISRFSL